MSRRAWTALRACSWLLASLCLTSSWHELTVFPSLALAQDWPLLVHEDFENGADRWQPFDVAVWRVESQDGNHFYSQFQKQTSYKPPHRSPLLISLLKEPLVSDFQLTLRVKSTHPDYGHRDCCVVFGYQDPAHFYYVHLGKQMDDHANQIFVVDDAPRTKISTKTTAGTPWDDQWHTVRIVRRSSDGWIAVYFDDLQNPVMTATDRRFLFGRIGIGSFDDTSAWDDVELKGVRYIPQTR
ncbi:MAG: hypothetical protein KatS3mg110_0782 [Pirellulaceae bacterium]|nr:MAG: hypothetical protein KatS3mg110_0782 [Pirellulaceae bacterium]